MTVRGIVEFGIYVEDVGRSAQFYRGLFAFPTHVSDEHFCALRVTEHQLLLLFQKRCTLEPLSVEGGVIPPHDGSGEQHFAFGIAAADFEGWRAKLRDCGVVIESEIAWPNATHSLYFRDPDHHLIELITRTDADSRAADN